MCGGLIFYYIDYLDPYALFLIRGQKWCIWCIWWLLLLYTNTYRRFYGVSDGVSMVYLDTPQYQYFLA